MYTKLNEGFCGSNTGAREVAVGEEELNGRTG